MRKHNQKQISVILATCKRCEILNFTLESFRQLNYDHCLWDLQVVDNADDPMTKALVESWSDKLPIHYLVEPKSGKNNALNRAIPEAQGELILLTDDDIIAAPDWLIQVWEGVQRWPKHMVFGGRILPSWPNGFSPPDMQNPYLVGAYAIANWDNPEGEYCVEKVFGANMAVRRELFECGWRFNGSVGPSQQKNYVMGSEADFVSRLFNAGFTPVYLPQALVYHQIRPEQMSFNWLKSRAYRAGLGSAALNHNVAGNKAIAGIPRYLVRRLGESYVRYIGLRLVGSSQAIEAGMRFHNLLGMAHGYRNIMKETRTCK